MNAVKFVFATLFAFVVAAPALAAKEGVVAPFEDSVQVEGQTLLLNGSGPLSVNRVKIYNVGIYLPARKGLVPEVLALPGEVRVKIVMVKSVESEIMSRRFIADIHANTSKEDRIKIANQILALGLGFGTIGDWNVGDIMTIDWIPAKGTVISWNGKPVAEPFKDPLLMQSILRIWLGDNVYDTKLKRLLLGGKD
jgi:hypothetical protein